MSKAGGAGLARDAGDCRPSRTEFALSNNVVQPIVPVEHFVLVRGELGPVDADGREGDLFGGIS